MLIRRWPTQQRLGGGFAGSITARCSSALRGRRQGVAALRHLCLDPGGQAGPAGRRRMPGGARALRARRGALWPRPSIRASRRQGPTSPLRICAASSRRRARRRCGLRGSTGRAGAQRRSRRDARDRGAQGRARHVSTRRPRKAGAGASCRGDGYAGWLPSNALRDPGAAPTHKVAVPRTLRSLAAPSRCRRSRRSRSEPARGRARRRAIRE